MSLYNMVHGMNPAVFSILPALGKHPDEYPRFRDCFFGDDEKPATENKIIVYTRTGGGNRPFYDNAESWKAQNEGDDPGEGPWNDDLRAMPGFLFDYDDDFDCTFNNFVFDIPPEWKDDVDLINNGKFTEVSKAYQDQCKKVFPKLVDQYTKVFSGEATDED